MLDFRTAIDRIIGFLPGLLAAVVILLIGYVLARLLGAVTGRLLMRMGFDRRLKQLGLGSERRGPGAASHATGSAVFWVVMLAAAIQAARALGLEMIAAGLASVMAFLPHVLAALLIMAGAVVLGNWVRDRILAPNGGERPTAQTPLVAGAVRAGILAFGAFMALRELQIAESIVTIAFALTLGAIALAAALAFGLGSRKAAEQLTSEWYERNRANGRRSVQPVETVPPTPPAEAAPLEGR